MKSTPIYNKASHLASDRWRYRRHRYCFNQLNVRSILHCLAPNPSSLRRASRSSTPNHRRMIHTARLSPILSALTGRSRSVQALPVLGTRRIAIAWMGCLSAAGPGAAGKVAGERILSGVSHVVQRHLTGHASSPGGNRWSSGRRGIGQLYILIPVALRSVVWSNAVVQPGPQLDCPLDDGAEPFSLAYEKLYVAAAAERTW